MKQQRMKNTNKGITLIALVITIIVMLILVAVTISMAVNGGLFDYAGKATGDTQNAIRDEQQLASGKVTVDNRVYNSIDEYLQGEKEITFTINNYGEIHKFTAKKGQTWAQWKEEHKDDEIGRKFYIENLMNFGDNMICFESYARSSLYNRSWSMGLCNR